MHSLSFVSWQGVRVLWFLGDLGYSTSASHSGGEGWGWGLENVGR